MRILSGLRELGRGMLWGMLRTSTVVVVGREGLYGMLLLLRVRVRVRVRRERKGVWQLSKRRRVSVLEASKVHVHVQSRHTHVLCRVCERCGIGHCKWVLTR